jgi:sulfite reductase (ferredoxin)
LRRSTVPGFAPVSDDSPEFAQWKLRYAQPQRQPGLYSVLVPVLLGNLSNEAAIQLADFAGAFGDDSIRANFGQNLQLRNIPEHYLANAFQILRQVADLASAPRLLANSVSCTGADTCKLGICLPKGALTATVDALRSSDLDLDQIPDFRLHLSGCPNTCGQHIVADLGFYGNVGTKEGQMFPAYAVVAGAAIGNGEARLARAIDRIAAHDLPSFVRDVLALWLQKKSEYASFAAYIDSDGTQDIRAVADRYRRIPTFAENAEYYKDWGASDKFSLVGKSAGECSAGIFDLIEIDLKKAKQLRETLTSTEDNGAALYKIALLAARALLVTRDIEVQTEAAVFDSFHKHFVVAGLVDSRFEPAIAAARRQDGLALAGQERDVLALLDAVNLLYQNMNDSLRSS